MRFENTKKLYSYWLNLKGQRLAPDRGEIEPSDIRDLLGDTFILEVNHDAKYIIYRLAGTRLCTSHGKELKGVGYLVQWSEEDSLQILKAVKDTYSNYTPCLIGHLGNTAQNRFLEFETLILPLQQIQDGTSRILGITTPAREPFWMGVEPIKSHRIRSVRPMIQQRDTFRSEHLIEVPPMLHEGDEPVQFDQEYRTVGHLKVLEGGKAV